MKYLYNTYTALPCTESAQRWIMMTACNSGPGVIPPWGSEAIIDPRGLFFSYTLPPSFPRYLQPGNQVGRDQVMVMHMDAVEWETSVSRAVAGFCWMWVEWGCSEKRSQQRGASVPTLVLPQQNPASLCEVSIDDCARTRTASRKLQSSKCC
jgi:hypothetical protein